MPDAPRVKQLEVMLDGTYITHSPYHTYNIQHEVYMYLFDSWTPVLDIFELRGDIKAQLKNVYEYLYTHALSLCVHVYITVIAFANFR